MGILIYDNVSKAFKETKDVRIYDNTNKVWKNCESLKVQKNGVWTEQMTLPYISKYTTISPKDMERDGITCETWCYLEYINKYGKKIGMSSAYDFYGYIDVAIGTKIKRSISINVKTKSTKEVRLNYRGPSQSDYELLAKLYENDTKSFRFELDDFLVDNSTKNRNVYIGTNVDIWSNDGFDVNVSGII